MSNAGFLVEVAKDQKTDAAKGIVLKQSTTKAAKGAKITITVNQYDGKSGENKNNTTNTTKPATTTNAPTKTTETTEKNKDENSPVN